MLFNKKNSRAIADAAEQAQVHGRSLWQDAWRRFSNNKAALCSVFILAAIILFVIAVPWVSAYTYDHTDWDNMQIPPSFATAA